MKKVFIAFAMFFAMLTSCSDTDLDQAQKQSMHFRDDSVNSKVSEVLNEEDYDTQKLMYLMLDSEDKLALWTYKINSLVSENNLSISQLTLIEDLKANINVKVFDEGDSQEIFKNVFLKSFYANAEKEFKTKEDQDLFVNTFNTVARRMPLILEHYNPGGGSIKPCSCNKGSFWSCPATITCKKANCSESESGCGFLGLFECNGLCFPQFQ